MLFAKISAVVLVVIASLSSSQAAPAPNPIWGAATAKALGTKVAGLAGNKMVQAGAVAAVGGTAIGLGAHAVRKSNDNERRIKEIERSLPATTSTEEVPAAEVVA
ncbi:hypothetical protein BKA69DRAFT_1080213 [Paraphysoderma sedebokerense]|nr:hypothetical protein BKA69DRAFT_1080213 [Paraphysoderma sedebokerense]